MNETTLRNLFARKLAGEKTSDLASELGVTKQKLVAEWRKLGLFNSSTEEATMSEPTTTTQEPEVIITEETTDDERPEEAVELAAPVVTVPDAPAAVVVGEPAEKPAPKKVKPTFDPELVRQAVELKRGGAKWSEVGKLLGCSWNMAWGVVNEVAPELCGKTK